LNFAHIPFLLLPPNLFFFSPTVVSSLRLTLLVGFPPSHRVISLPLKQAFFRAPPFACLETPPRFFYYLLSGVPKCSLLLVPLFKPPLHTPHLAPPPLIAKVHHPLLLFFPPPSSVWWCFDLSLCMAISPCGFFPHGG